MTALRLVGVFCAVAGVSILGFWIVVLGTRKLRQLLDLSADAARGHVAAEFVTAALLLAGGVAVIAKPHAHWASVLAALGLGTMVYALTTSPSLYAKAPLIRATLYASWLFAIPAIVLLLRNT